MPNRTIRWLPLAILATVALAACGGPTQADVIARGNAICSATIAAIRRAPTGTAGSAVVLRAVAQQARQLKALPRPKQDAMVLNRFIAAQVADDAEYASLVRAEGSGDTSAAQQATKALQASQAPALARSYGLSRCASAGATVGS